MLLVIFVFLFLFPCMTTAAVKNIFSTGNELKDDLNSKKNSISETYGFGIIVGVHDSFSGKSICTSPGKQTLNQLASVVKKYLNEHPENLHFSSWSIIYDALSQAFPCAQK